MQSPYQNRTIVLTNVYHDGGGELIKVQLFHNNETGITAGVMCLMVVLSNMRQNLFGLIFKISGRYGTEFSLECFNKILLALEANPMAYLGNS